MNDSTVFMSRRYEIDAGHRVPLHPGKCARLHGHRYVIEAEVVGPIRADGMIVDFGIVKAVMADVLEPFDHRTILHGTDPLVELLADAGYGDDVMTVNAPPTAEHLARLWGEAIATALAVHADDDGPRLNAITVHETPNCAARWLAP